MPTRDLPPQTGAGSPREIYGEYGVDGGYSDLGATVLVNPKPKSIYEHMDRIWTGLVGKRATGRAVEPDEMALVPARAVTASGAVSGTTDDRRLIVGNSASAITLTLPALATVTSGWTFEFLNIGAGTVTLDPNGSELIAGVATLDFPTGTSARVIADTTLGWRVLGREAIPRIPGAGAVAGGLVTTNAAGTITGISAATAALPRGYIDGLTLANNATDLTNDIDIAAGVCRNTANTIDILLAATLTKQLDASWAVGTNAGGRDTGSIADGTWHVWLIRNTTTSVIDALFSLSATAPTVPSGWAAVRRIGAVLRESSALVRFAQNGDAFWRNTPVSAINTTGIGTTSVSETVAGLPSGVKVDAILAVRVSNASNNAYYLFGDPDAGALPQPTAAISHLVASGSAGEWSTIVRVRTNASRQIERRMWATGGSGVSNVWGIVVMGWADARGKDA
jgi:hypothetical protein